MKVKWTCFIDFIKWSIKEHVFFLKLPFLIDKQNRDNKLIQWIVVKNLILVKMKIIIWLRFSKQNKKENRTNTRVSWSNCIMIDPDITLSFFLMQFSCCFQNFVCVYFKMNIRLEYIYRFVSVSGVPMTE